MRWIALALALLIGPAAAQVNQANLPSNTVVGRLGIGTGPAQAIPFATLGAQLNSTAAVNGSGDVTLSGTLGSITSVLGNIPNDTTLALDLLATNAVAPSTPASGKTRIYVDSTQKVLSAKNDAGTVSVTVVPNIASATQFVTGISVGGVPQTATIDGQTLKASPSGSDEVLIWDVSGSAWKKTTVSAIGTTSGVSGIDSKVGAFTTGNGLDSTGGNLIEITPARRTLPTHQTFTSGSGTYTTPANVLWIEIELVGGGGGGGAPNGTGGGAGGNTCWNTTGAACTSPVYQAGGGALGSDTNPGTAGSGGTISGSGTCDWQAVGGAGGGSGASISSSTGVSGGVGGSSSRGGGGAGIYSANGGAGGTNTGGGGAGGGQSAAASVAGGGGGGAGATCHVIINTPAATYTYAVGASGAGMTGSGTGAFNGGAGAAGEIVVYEHYGS